MNKLRLRVALSEAGQQAPEVHQIAHSDPSMLLVAAAIIVVPATLTLVAQLTREDQTCTRAVNTANEKLLQHGRTWQHDDVRSAILQRGVQHCRRFSRFHRSPFITKRYIPRFRSLISFARRRGPLSTLIQTCMRMRSDGKLCLSFGLVGRDQAS